MYKLMQIKLFIILLGISFLLSCLLGCGEDTDGDDDNGEASTLPPDYSMTIDLSAFDEGELGAPSLNAPATQLNYRAAKATASVINKTLVAKLKIPVAIFTTAKNTTPERQDDGSWLWSYSKTIGTKTFTANLTGKKEVDEFVWSMKVSNNNLDNFEWYTGRNSRDNRTGSWQFFDSDTPNEANLTYTIEWNADGDSEGAKRERTFTNQEAGSSHFGNVVRYIVEGEMASISFTEASKNTTTVIEWNLKTTAGSITSPVYKDGEKACWDENKNDVPCD